MVLASALIISLLTSAGAFAPRPDAGVKATSSTRLFSSPPPPPPMPFDDDKMVFYAFGMNLALQTGGNLPSILGQEELRIVAEGFCASLRGDDTREDAQTILETYGPALNKIIESRAGKAADEVKRFGKEFIANFLEDFPEARQTQSGLVYVEREAGTGETPKPNSVVEVHYHGTLTDGFVFDSSFERGEPITFPLNQVIKGWTEGLQLMKEGGKATMILPSHLAYGDEGSGSAIPPGATLVFEVELIKITGTADPGPAEEETEIIELPDGTKMRVPKGVKARIVEEEE